MSAKNDGGPAFPLSIGPQDDPTLGMSLRDYFAGQALVGYMVSTLLHEMPQVYGPKMAEYAYTQADAMLAERNKSA